CSFSVCNRIEFFKESLFLLLCGVGVGFSVEFEHVDKLPALAFKIDETKVTHFTIEDSIEGWSNGLEKLLDSYLNGYLVEFNYSKVRAKGEELKTSGGRAPGHVPLRKSLEKIRVVLDGALGRKLKPIEVYDIVMHSCDAVLAGGVRRSATICLFSIDDGEMMGAKTGNWFTENPQRARSNNSVKLIRNEVTKAQFLRIFERQKQWGEPGFYFAEKLNYGSNPCVEIGLNPFLPDGKAGWAFCNLTEINGSMINNEADFRVAVKAATIIGTLQASYTNFPYLGEVTEKICQREALLGVSITGMMDSPDLLFDASLQREMAKYAIDVNREMASVLGIESAARITCVKPAGTTSLILGTASGIHPRHARRYFRRVQANTDDRVYRHFNKSNSHCCEPSHWSANKTDDVITFCIESPAKAILREEVSAVGMLEKVLLTQQNWVKYGTARPESSPGLMHNVSNTVSVKDDEWEDVSKFIWENRDSFTGVAMLSFMGDKQYVQAPHEEVVSVEDQALWDTYCSNYNSVDYTTLHEQTDATQLKEVVACAGGACDLV
ncbi:MAG: recombinase, partial [Lentisphaeria bacterium]